ncbi:MAG: D-glycerate dehydrogenase [Gemmatimonadaceae bacterium]|nr:D-glycerate dehydrogenase [Gemmatimonadaceae bacterium]MCC6431017.1 D-glycerate dehydrogenase [Gemmatimonadaceae bacterium]
MSVRPSVVVTRRLPDAVEAAIAERYDVRFNRTDVSLTADQMTQVLRTTDIVLCTVTDKIRAELFDHKVQTRLLANFGVGVNHIDREAARKYGVMISNTPDVLTDDTADIALALILMTMRRLGEGERHLRTGAWSGWRPTHLMGRSPHGKTLGIIGYGRIGRALARQASSALGMHILYYAPRDVRIDDPSTAGPEQAERVESVEALLARADVVSLHCPSTPETRHLINAERLAMMKPTSYLINTARGDIVDEYALTFALREGQIAGAGLDVFEWEPTVVAELREMEKAVLLPHMGSGTIETRTAMGMRALANIDAFVAGQRPPDLVEF